MRYRRHLERAGNDSRLAWKRLVALYRQEWPTLKNIEDHLAFLLEEAERIDIPDPFQNGIKEAEHN